MPSPVHRMVVGLGNPGPRYANTLHNVGAETVRALAKELGVSLAARKAWEAEYAVATVEGNTLHMLVPQTFMNLSGNAVRKALRALPVRPTDLLVVLDDVYLPLGTIRVRPSGSPAGHNGMAHILAAVGPAVPRMRLGVGSPPPHTPLEEWVLSSFRPSDRPALTDMTARALQGLRMFAESGTAAFPRLGSLLSRPA